ncbi:MAG: hypothetical protein ACRDF0_07020 [Candidatus Limnocylindria bacterium]
MARVEIDFRLVGDDLVVAHDEPRRAARPPLLRDALALAREELGPTLLELDAKDDAPWPWPVVERLARLVAPISDRIVVTSPADWNIRRLQYVDAGLRVGFDPQYYLDWERRPERLGPPRGAYGYLDAHPLARRRRLPVAEYMRERLHALAHFVPGASEIHLRLALLERLLAAGLPDAVAVFHRAGLLVDVWTLDAGSARWRERLERAVNAGVDIVTTNTPRALAEAWAERRSPG